MNGTETALAEMPELEANAAATLARIPLIAIRDAETFALSVEDRGEIKRRLGRIAEVMDPICAAAHTTWKTAVGKRDALRAPYLEADKAYARAMGAWEQEQQRQRRLAEEGARRERERLEGEERARVAAEEARLRKEAEDQRLTQAAAAEAQGDSETAERLLEAPVEVPVVVPRPVFVPMAPVAEAPKATGVAFRDNWSAEVVDLMALVTAVASRTVPITVLLPNMPALNGMARALKGAMAVPGVRAISERIAAQRSQ